MEDRRLSVDLNRCSQNMECNNKVLLLLKHLNLSYNKESFVEITRELDEKSSIYCL